MFTQINTFLDRYVLLWPVRFLTHRFVILMTMTLLIPLIIFASHTIFVLGINSYLNTMSVAVSSIVLLYATLSEIRQKRIAEMQETRAREDHTHVTQMHKLLLETISNQQQEVEELKQMVAVIQGLPYQRKPRPVVDNLQNMHPRGKTRFSIEDTEDRMNCLTE